MKTLIAFLLLASVAIASPYRASLTHRKPSLGRRPGQKVASHNTPSAYFYRFGGYGGYGGSSYSRSRSYRPVVIHKWPRPPRSPGVSAADYGNGPLTVHNPFFKHTHKASVDVKTTPGKLTITELGK